MTLPRHEELRLAQAVTGRDRASLILDGTLSPDEERAVQELVARRLAGEPLQYLEGTVSFAGLELVVDPRVLIPRPETEELFELAAGLISGSPATIVDLGTGSGNLALALKHRFPGADVFATDLSTDAADLARANADRLGAEVTVLVGDLFDPLPDRLRGAVDLMVTNPPYVATTDALPADVRDHEPALALFGGPDGLEVVRRIGGEAASWLVPGGMVICEIAESQGAAAPPLFFGMETEVRRDLAGKERFVVGTVPAATE